MISLSKGDIYFHLLYSFLFFFFFKSFTVYLLNLYLLFNLDALSPILCVCVCEEKDAAGL